MEQLAQYSSVGYVLCVKDVSLDAKLNVILLKSQLSIAFMHIHVDIHL